ncbi:hypothetical protein [Candidatus Binatus sp.]|uniref:hypothetical protein n=1 Tax=Candidatus Binatus sp. TaxID=2811406 RepID=UPI002F94A21C
MPEKLHSVRGQNTPELQTVGRQNMAWPPAGISQSLVSGSTILVGPVTSSPNQIGNEFWFLIVTLEPAHPAQALLPAQTPLTTTARIAIVASTPMLETLVLTDMIIRSPGPTGLRDLSRRWLFSAAVSPTMISSTAMREFLPSLPETLCGINYRW